MGDARLHQIVLGNPDGVPWEHARVTSFNTLRKDGCEDIRSLPFFSVYLSWEPSMTGTFRLILQIMSYPLIVVNR
jgi:hypothetical protein